MRWRQKCEYTKMRGSIFEEEIPIEMVCWLLFGQAEELYKSLPRFDFGGGSPHIPHFEVNVPRCCDVDEIKATGRINPALVSRLLAVQVEFCVFEDVV